MKGYKAYNKDLICRGFQYKEGETYTHEGDIELCKSGFHFCENPLDVLDYYDLCDSEFTEVEPLGKTITNHNKTVTDSIKIGIKLDLKGFIDTAFIFLWERCKEKNKASGYYSQLAASGDYSQLAASGSYSQLAVSGYYSQLAASGNYSQLAASGNSSKLAASGDYSQLASSGNYSQLAASGDSSKLAASGYSSKLASSGYSSKLASSGYSSQLASSGDYSQLAASGNYSQLASSGSYSQLASSGDYSRLAASGDSSQLAVSGYSSKLDIQGADSVGAGIGVSNRIKATLGSWITLAEWEYDDKKSRYIPICVKSAQIDGEVLKPDTWYELKDGEFTEVEE